LKTLSATSSVRVENTVIREVEGKKVPEVKFVHRRKWKAELVPARGDKTVEVETSPNARPLVKKGSGSRR
jgi:hypothetical protein